MAGCSTDMVGFEVAEYVNQDILGITQLETKALERYAAVTGQNYTSDQALQDALENAVLPLYGRFVDLLGQVRLQNDEIRQLHVLYLNGAQLTYRGFKTMRLALEAQDAFLLQRANAEIENGRKEIDKWHGQLMTLYEAHGVRTAKDSKDSVFKRMLFEPQVN